MGWPYESFDCLLFLFLQVTVYARQTDLLVVVDVIEEIHIRDLPAGEHAMTIALWVFQELLLLLVRLVQLLAHVVEQGPMSG